MNGQQILYYFLCFMWNYINVSVSLFPWKRGKLIDRFYNSKRWNEAKNILNTYISESKAKLCFKRLKEYITEIFYLFLSARKSVQSWLAWRNTLKALGLWRICLLIKKKENALLRCKIIQFSSMTYFRFGRQQTKSISKRLFHFSRQQDPDVKWIPERRHNSKAQSRLSDSNRLAGKEVTLWKHSLRSRISHSVMKYIFLYNIFYHAYS